MTTDKIRIAANQLELDIYPLLEKFWENNGICDIEIKVENFYTERYDDQDRPVKMVIVKIII